MLKEKIAEIFEGENSSLKKAFDTISQYSAGQCLECQCGDAHSPVCSTLPARRMRAVDELINDVLCGHFKEKNRSIFLGKLTHIKSLL